MSRFKKFKAYVVSNAPIFDFLKKCIEVAAIIVAAIWTYRTFIHKELPTLEKTPKITSELSIDSFSPSKVNVNFFVHVKNIGKTSFEVTSCKISYWLIPKDTIARFTYFPEMIYGDLHPATESFFDISFNAHYPPETEVSQGFDFIFDKDAEKAIMIKADCQFSTGKGSFFEKETTWPDYTYAAKFECVPEKEHK
jgi:hypothetical protein